MKAFTMKSAVGNLLGEVVSHIAQRIASASRGALAEDEVSLVIPPVYVRADLTFRCFQLAASWKMDPAAIASELSKCIEPSSIVDRYVSAGPYLNIHLRRETVGPRLFSEVSSAKDSFGRSLRLADETVMIEYVSPNTNKPLHLGHVRNAVLGRSVAALIESQGAGVVLTDIINDRGIHIAKSMLAYQRWANGKTPDTEGIKGDHFVGKLYVQFEKELSKEKRAWCERNGIDVEGMDELQTKEVDLRFNAESELLGEAREILIRWEKMDPEIRSLWQIMNGWVYEGFDKTYSYLRISFDKHYYESEIYQGGKELIQDATEKGIFLKADNGAVIAPLQQRFGIQDKAVLRSDGTGLYVTQDINLAIIKFEEYNLTRSIYCIGSEQDFYMRQLFAILDLLGYSWASGLQHLSYGMVYLPEGKMKSREGIVVDADQLISEVKKCALEEIEQRYQYLDKEESNRRASAIALAGIVFSFLIVGKGSDIHFNPKDSISFEGKTGPYLQYAYARCASILRRSECETGEVEKAHLGEDLEWRLLYMMMLYPSVVSDAADNQDPAVLASYLVEVAQVFGSFYHEHEVLKSEEPFRSSRLALVSALRIVLGNGMRLLGIDPLDEM